MIQNWQNEQTTKAGNWVALRLNKYEAILVFIFAIELILKTTLNLSITKAIALTLETLAILYFFNAFAQIDDEKAGGLEIFLNKLVSYCCSVSIIGILFRLNNWPGFKELLLTGSFALIILMFITFIIKSNKPELKIFTNRLFLRIFLIAAIGLSINFTPIEKLIKIGLVKKVEVEMK